jgi:hypothetical protein
MNIYLEMILRSLGVFLGVFFTIIASDFLILLILLGLFIAGAYFKWESFIK